jgi:hypothetical protein
MVSRVLEGRTAEEVFAAASYAARTSRSSTLPPGPDPDDGRRLKTRARPQIFSRAGVGRARDRDWDSGFGLRWDSGFGIRFASSPL